MAIKRIRLLLGLIFLISGFVFADSISATGTAEKGYATVENALSVSGPGLSLFETSVDGPSTIGVCNVGTCSTSFTIGSGICGFASPCITGTASGSVAGFGTAQWLVTALVFTGSFSYPGGAGTFQGPVSLTGTILGYDLVNCSPAGYACQLGQQVFSLVLSGQGTASYDMNGGGGISGVTYNFDALITPVPEPSSILLVGCSLAAMWIMKRKAASPENIARTDIPEFLTTPRVEENGSLPWSSLCSGRNRRKVIPQILVAGKSLGN